MPAILALFALALSTPALAGTLYTVDDNILVRTDVALEQGEVHSIEVGELEVRIGGLTQEADGSLWATGGNQNRWLLHIDATTGKTTQVANLGIGLDALAYDPASQTLYGATASNWLFEVDAASGEVTPIGSMGRGGAVQDLMWVEGVGLVGRWESDTGGMLGRIDTFGGDVTAHSGAMVQADGTRMVFSAEDGVFYESGAGRVRAHRATGADYNAFMVYTVR